MTPSVNPKLRIPLEALRRRWEACLPIETLPGERNYLDRALDFDHLAEVGPLIAAHFRRTMRDQPRFAAAERALHPALYDLILDAFEPAD